MGQEKSSPVKAPLSSKLLTECQGIIYAKWCEAFDSRKKIIAERNDGTPDWGLFHNERLRCAQERFDRYTELLAEMNDYLR